MTRTPEDRSKWKAVHTRKIDMRTFETGPGAIVVEGTLIDDRLYATYPMSGERRPPGVVHHMTIRMHVVGPDLTIEAIEVAMPAVPREECRETQSSLDRLLGMRIAAGFTEKVKAQIGGAAGCTHLTALLLAMAPAAVQGFWAAISQKAMDPALYGDRAVTFLTDTCRVWRRDGPLMAEFKSNLETAAEDK
ncbi:MAG: DUF2889 domain-containing protein [Desulfobacterales bacterium]|nr:DUF2889 domain-containing protein [Desulfobacterales bacterium]